MAGKQALVRPQRGPKRLHPAAGGPASQEEGAEREAPRHRALPFLPHPSPPRSSPAQARGSHFPLPLELRFFLLLLPLLFLVQAAALAHRAPEDVDTVGGGGGAVAVPVPVAPGGGGRVRTRAGAGLPAPVPLALPGLGALPCPLLFSGARSRSAPVLLVVLGALGVLGAGRAPAAGPTHPDRGEERPHRRRSTTPAPFASGARERC